MISLQEISIVQWVALSSILAAGYFAFSIVYNVYFHPLRKFPGPFWWRATHIPWAWHVYHGTVAQRTCELEREYGEVVRVSPNEVNFFKSQAWNDIYGHKQANGNGNLRKFNRTRRKEVNHTPSIVTAVEEETHRRIRRLLSHAFSEKALSAQLPLVNSYVDFLINSLRQKVKEGSGSATVNVVKWYNYTTFDVLGELAFGQSFGCLQDDILHPWITNLFLSIKDGQRVRVALTFIRPIRDFINFIKPRTGAKAQLEEHDFAANRVKARIQAGDIERADFMSCILKYNDERGMSLKEIESTAALLILAGSETTASFLSAMSYYMLAHPTHYAKLRDLIRSTFADEASITPTALSSMEYFTACVEETFRMFPPAPMGGMPRVTNPKGSHIAGDFVAGNTIVIVPTIGIHMSERNFKDSQKFVPERWYKGDLCPKRYRNDDRKAMRPFSVGPRDCIGKNLAYTELRLVYARMLWNFDMELTAECRDWDNQKVWAIWDKKPLYVKLTSRQR